jgi:GTPase SAR1 family protein
MNGTDEHTFHVLLCGDSNVGKTTFFMHYKEGTNFDHVVLPPQATVGMDTFYVHFTLPSCDAHVHVYLQDIPGGLQNSAVLPSYLRGVDVFLFLYDITHRASFDNLRSRWRGYRDTYCTRPAEAVSIVIGNKKDLVEGDATEVRQVSREEAKELARDIGAAHCYELSAKGKGPAGLSNLQYPVNIALEHAVKMRRKAQEAARGTEDDFSDPEDNDGTRVKQLTDGRDKTTEGACCD